jgi:predicted small secreted protein
MKTTHRQLLAAALVAAATLLAACSDGEMYRVMRL